MIKINFFYKVNSIIKVEISGHANFDKLGKDIVCAGVSSVVFGTLNALNQLIRHKEFKVTQENNKIVIEILNITEINQIILHTMLWQLKTINHHYSKNVILKEVY